MVNVNISVEAVRLHYKAMYKNICHRSTYKFSENPLMLFICKIKSKNEER